MNPKSFEAVTGSLFTLMALAQAARFWLRVPVTAGGHVVPVWLSAVAFFVFASLAIWAFRLVRRA